ncbi:MAG: flagellin [Synergistaceae bacterium]|nr:flagellin [Synergistaceae bacterium]
MVIQHNIPALQTYNIVNNTSNALQKSIAKLSSGLRINSAADDAAGLAISEKMRSQVRGLDRAVANTQDGISLIQTAEGALSETHSILQRMRELSVQAANDTLTQQDRAYIQEEVDQLKDEITRVGNTTQFNKKKLLDGSSSGLWSSSDMETKALIRGSLREVDQFGQKKSIEGNYKIRVKADPGQAEVQKSDIMTIKHPNVLTNKTINAPDGVKDVQVDNMTPGTYSLVTEKNQTAVGAKDAIVTGSYGVGGTQYTTSYSISSVTSPSGGSGTWAFTLGGESIGSVTVGDGASVPGTLFTTGATTSGWNTVVSNAAAKGVTLGFDGTNITVSKLGSEGATLAATASGNSFAATVGKIATTAATPNPAKTKVGAGAVFKVNSTANNIENASILFEVTGRDTTNKTITLKATSTRLTQDGKNYTSTMDDIVVTDGGATVNIDKLVGDNDSTNAELTIALNQGMLSAVEDSGKFVAYVSAGKMSNATGALKVDVTGTIDKDWDDAWDTGVFGQTTTGTTTSNNTLVYALDGDNLQNTEVHFKNYILNERTGTVSEGDITLITNNDFKVTDGKLNATDGAIKNGDTLASFTSSYIGKTASGDVKLRDLDKFWNSEGKFMLDDAKTLTLNQGDGKTANVTLYANDTLDEVAKKINNAIATDLGQSKYVDDATRFATFVDSKGANSEAVPGTFVIRSVVPGAQGEITFSGDQEILDAFSLNTIQDSKETVYNVDVFDEHTGKVLAQNVKTTGNVMHGVIHENVDVEFGALKGVEAKWNSNLNKFVYTAKEQSTTLHIADNTTVLQIGANEGEDLAMDIGDMRAHALGLDEVNMMSHDRAARSITVIDNAIDKVSTQRAKLGAYQNRLEYTANNLTTASENLTSAESRIRDADMAKEMMEFTKLNIMLQAGNSMLAQANQQPQNVLSLIR